MNSISEVKCKIILMTFLLFLSAGCATSSSNFKPDQINKDQGAFIGKISIRNKSQDITRNCYAEFTDDKDIRKVYVDIDEWACYSSCSIQIQEFGFKSSWW